MAKHIVVNSNGGESNTTITIDGEQTIAKHFVLRAGIGEVVRLELHTIVNDVHIDSKFVSEEDYLQLSIESDMHKQENRLLHVELMDKNKENDGLKQTVSKLQHNLKAYEEANSQTVAIKLNDDVSDRINKLTALLEEARLTRILTGNDAKHNTGPDILHR